VAVRLGALAIAANLVAAMVLMGPMEHGGLALASSIGAYVNLFGLLWMARRDFGLLGGRALVISAVRTLAASAPLALWCVLLRFVAPAGGFAQEAAWLAVTVAGGAVVFLVASTLLGSPERATLLGMLPSRRRG
jgi:putative peptidoglycan lipid II flippase